MSSHPLPDDDVLSPLDVAQVAGLDAVQALLMVEAKAWAARIAQLNELAALSERQQRAGVPQFRALELAGSWNVGQVTAERWLGEADRFATALPITLAMLETGALLCHQASVLLHRTSGCTPEVARAVEAEVLPEGARLCPSDLGRRIDRVRLRLGSEQIDPAEAEKQHAEQVARRRTFVRPDVDGAPARPAARAAGGRV